MKRLIAVGVILMGLVIAGFALFSKKSDEELIKERLAQLAHVVSVDPDENAVFRARRLQRSFEEIFTPTVRIEVEELESFSGGRDELVPLATRAGTRFQRAEVELSSEKIDLIGGTAAKVDATAVLSSDENGEPHRDERRVHFGLTKTEDGWKVDSVLVTPKAE
jgi:SnoaL-like domain